MITYSDRSYAPEQSLLLRYHRAIDFEGIGLADLKTVSVQEGARIIRLMEHKGVAIWIADESTLMSTGTFKALEACFITALCKKKKYERIVFSSGANLGSALAFYGRKAGIETFFFHPSNTSWKLDRSLFDHPAAHLISVDKPEREVKKAARLFADLAGIPHVPEMEWRFSATGLRSLFVFEHMKDHDVRFDWVSQVICAAFGPIGFYNTARKAVKEGTIAKAQVPRFLGIQQAGLSPMVHAWGKHHGRILPDDVHMPGQDLLDPTLYNTNPDSSYPILYDHLNEFGGQLCSVDRDQYEQHLPLLLQKLAGINIRLNTRRISNREEILENAGLINLAGILNAIDQGIINQKENVLAFFTGGAGRHSGEEAVAEYEITRDSDLTKSVDEYVRRARSRSNMQAVRP